MLCKIRDYALSLIINFVFNVISAKLKFILDYNFVVCLFIYIKKCYFII